MIHGQGELKKKQIIETQKFVEFLETTLHATNILLLHQITSTYYKNTYNSRHIHEIEEFSALFTHS